MIRQLTIQLRRRQLVDIYGNPVYYAGPNPLSLAAVAGTVDTTWYDFTEYVEGLQDIELDWSATVDSTGTVTEGNFTPTKGATSTLSFERTAYNFLKQYLIEDVAATLNQVEVQITDTNCGRYIGYVITSQQLEWCEFNSTCVFNVNLKQIEDYTNCIQRTTIADNWQGWFQNEPLNGKKHPRFGYCIEKRPNWTLVLSWYLSSLLAVVVSLIYTVFYPILLIVWLLQTALHAVVEAINFLVGVINSIIDAINTLPGISIPNIPLINNPDVGPAPTTPVQVFLNWANVMIEEAGCGREQPAPLIRDYILNVCNKCGVQVSASTADIFFAPSITLTYSDAQLHTDPNPYYNACYFFPQVKRGVRRFRHINVFDGSSDPDTTTYYLPENAPILSGEDFFNEISKPYNQQWRIVVDSTGTPNLYIKRKDHWGNQSHIYDFSQNGADSPKIIEGICYEQQEVKIPASCSFLYADDPAEKCGVEAGDFYNGKQLVSFGNTVINPLYSGVLDKMTNYAATHFNCDGSSTNYIYDALQVVYSLYPLNPFILAIGNELGGKVERYANYKVLMQSETCSNPKIIIWDGDTDNPSTPNYLNATAIRDKINIAGTVYTIGKSGLNGTVPSITTPDINTLYPTEIPAAGGTTFVPASIPAPIPWIANHFPQTQVETTNSGGIAGTYVIIDPFGSTLFPAAAILVNFPMYFEPHYKGTLWDKFHWIDDPIKNPRLNKTWKLKIPLCKEDIDRLSLTNNVNGQQLARTVLLDTAFYNIGIITSISASYKTGDEEGTGQYIEIKGIV